jgi:hypothetical protein
VGTQDLPTAVLVVTAAIQALAAIAIAVLTRSLAASTKQYAKSAEAQVVELKAQLRESMDAEARRRRLAEVSPFVDLAAQAAAPILNGKLFVQLSRDYPSLSNATFINVLGRWMETASRYDRSYLRLQSQDFLGAMEEFFQVEEHYRAQLLTQLLAGHYVDAEEVCTRALAPVSQALARVSACADAYAFRTPKLPQPIP